MRRKMALMRRKMGRCSTSATRADARVAERQHTPVADA
jgi:hypothetical protein